METVYREVDRADKAQGVSTIWMPQPRQKQFITCPADDVAFGGSRGGGKSDAVIGDWISHSSRYGKDAVGIVFRRERTQLVEMIERAKQVLTPLGFRFHEQDKVFRGPEGEESRLRFAYLERDSDADAYQGWSATRIYFEELGTFPSESPVNRLQGILRSGAGVPCRMKATCNPGGPGHSWVKARYRLDTHPGGFVPFEFTFTNPYSGKTITKTRMFVPSRVSDNRFLGDEYVANLHQVGSAALVKAWLEGDWTVVEGAFFDCWTVGKHVLAPFKMPAEWPRFRSADWGSASPFSIGWWAVVTDDYRIGRDRHLPRGAIIRYREWYGASAPNVGLKLPAEEVAKGILARETDEERKAMVYSVLDPAAFASDGGPSIAERFSLNGVSFRRADNRRVAKVGAMVGWDLVRARLIGIDGQPMLYVFSTCTDTIRTLPAMQHDQVKPEDIDTSAEDHAADDIRYACASRPWIPKPPKETRPKNLVYEAKSDGRVVANMSIREIIEQKRKRREAM